MQTVHGFPHPPARAGVCRFMVMLMALVILSACAPPSNQAEGELRKEIQALKTQMAAMQEKLNEVQLGQQAILDSPREAGVHAGAHAGAPGRAAPAPVPNR